MVMGAIAAGAASLCVLAACVRLRAGRGTRYAFAGMVTLSAGAVIAFHQWLGLAESVYTTLLVMVIVLTALPFLLAAGKRQRAR